MPLRTAQIIWSANHHRDPPRQGFFSCPPAWRVACLAGATAQIAAITLIAFALLTVPGSPYRETLDERITIGEGMICGGAGVICLPASSVAILLSAWLGRSRSLRLYCALSCSLTALLLLGLFFMPAINQVRE